MSWCEQHQCPSSQCDEFRHGPSPAEQWRTRALQAERKLEALRTAAEQHLRDNPSGRGTLRLCAAIEDSKK